MPSAAKEEGQPRPWRRKKETDKTISATEVNRKKKKEEASSSHPMEEERKHCSSRVTKKN